MMQDLGDLGFLVHAKKCVGVDDPQRAIEALGMTIDFASQTFRCPLRKLERIRQKALGIWEQRRSGVAAKKLAGLAGLVVSTTVGVGPVARIRSRSMLSNLEARLNAGEDPSSRSAWRRKIALSEEAIAELAWWVANALGRVNLGMPIAHLLPVIVGDVTLASDASATGWGGWIGVGSEASLASKTVLENLMKVAPAGVTLTEVARAARTGIEVAGSFTEEQSRASSSWRELFGALMVVSTLAPVLRNMRIRLRLDSSVATGALGGTIPSSLKIMGGSMNKGLQALVVQLLDRCGEINLDLQAVWHPRAENARADAISHYFEHDQYDYTLIENWVAWLERYWGPHDVDRFASNAENCVVYSGAFNSQYGSSDKGWEWADALTLHWGRLNNWVHPPYMLIDRVLDHCIACKARGTLIVPDWPSASWWPRLFRRADTWQSLGRRATHAPIGWPCSPAIQQVVWLGHADRVLFYPSKGSAFAERHLPRGAILAVRFDFRNE